MNEQLDRITPGWVAKANLAFDILVIVAAVMLATYDGGRRQSSLLLAVALTGFILGAAALRLYSPSTPRRPIDQAVLTTMLLLALGPALYLCERSGFIDNTRAFSVFGFTIIAFVWLAVGRAVVFAPLHRLTGPVEDVLIVGSGPLGVATEHALQHSQRRRHVVGFLSFDGEATSKGLAAPMLGNAADLEKVLHSQAVAEVFLAGRMLQHGPMMQQLASLCEHVGQPFAVPVHGMHLERARLSDGRVGEDGYLHYYSTTIRPYQYALKRMVDIVGSAVGLVVLSPLLITTAVLIKLTDGGPVFYQQQRVGLHGATFGMLKFRSMVMNADALVAKLMEQNEMAGGVVFKMKADPRITAIGRIIRKFSIDELPQLINILRGDMTIVGPRPALPREVAQYQLWQRRRLSVRPGLTCYWQVSGRNEIGFDEWMGLDLKYVDNWSLAIDIELILRTLPIVVTGRGAS